MAEHRTAPQRGVSKNRRRRRRRSRRLPIRLMILAAVVLVCIVSAISVLGKEPAPEPAEVAFSVQGLRRALGQSVTAEEFVHSGPEGLTYAFAQEPQLTAEGNQTVTIVGKNSAGEEASETAALMLLQDRHAPVIEGPSEVRLYLGETVDLKSAFTVRDDLDPAPTLTVDDSGVNLTAVGTYTVPCVARDGSGNESVRNIQVRIYVDNEGPEILGVNALSVYAGSTVSYRRGVVAKDDFCDSPQLTVDSSAVDLSTPGTYPVIYKATDDRGNETTVQTTLTVEEKPETFVEESVIYAKVDEVLASIITEDMTPKQKVEAVFKWFKRNCYYTNSTEKTDRLQTAYTMLTVKNGDCYRYYAACSVMLERLGLPEISVERSRNSVRPTRHYWSMVSLDGGETYYHIDVCPHFSFEGMETCLVTDADLAWCDEHLPGYYTMDAGVYPATPAERP